MHVIPSMPTVSGLSLLWLWNTDLRRPDLAMKEGLPSFPSSQTGVTPTSNNCVKAQGQGTKRGRMQTHVPPPLLL